MSLLNREFILEFYYDPNVSPSQNVRCDIKKILEILSHLSNKETKWSMGQPEKPSLHVSSSTYNWEYEVILKDTSKISEEMIKKIYFTKANVAAVMKKYDIAMVFGTKENDAAFFGKEVPALLVYKDSNFGYPQEVYPRNEKGSIITIEEYLSSL